MLRVLLDCKVNVSFDWHLQIIHVVLFNVVFFAPLAIFSRMNQRYHILHVNQTNCNPSQDLICCYMEGRPTALLTSNPILQENEVTAQITTTQAL